MATPLSQKWIRACVPRMIVPPLEREQRLYNYLHSSARFREEHAFGRLKQKFPRMRRGLPFKPENAGKVMTACIVLYNFMLRHDGRRGEPEEHAVRPRPTGSYGQGRRHATDRSWYGP